MNYNFKKVLVTGGAGCIGMAVCKELLSRGYTCIAMELPEVSERVYNDLMYTWPGKFKFIYSEEQVPQDAFVI